MGLYQLNKLFDNKEIILDSISNSYSQVFFSNKKSFAIILIIVSFTDIYAGLAGLLAVLLTNSIAYFIGLDKQKISIGYYGFNSLLCGLGLGLFYQPGFLLLLIIFSVSLFTLIIAVVFEGVIGKYGLPNLSMPFVFSMWVFIIATSQFKELGLSERGIYTLNEIYSVGGQKAILIYEWFNSLNIPNSLRTYFLSLSAILFQYNVFTGMLIAAGLLAYSRIAFSLSFLCFYISYLFYGLTGVEFGIYTYSYIGFNYILTAIAIGGFFLVPNIRSYLWACFLIPVTVVVTISMSSIMAKFGLPVFSLPFNIIVLTFLYVLKFRVKNHELLPVVNVQHNMPERNLYAYKNYKIRGEEKLVSIFLPFFGDWTVTQGHDGEYTHKEEWKHAWDFEICDDDGNTYSGEGDYCEDYYCYNKAILAPARGIVEEVIDGIEDNIIGEKNVVNNWGNTVIIKHAEYLYTKLCHLKAGSITVKKGQHIELGEVIGLCGNSGLSPYPHLHFQVQQFPYVGAHTIYYPFSSFVCNKDGKIEFCSNSIPENKSLVSNVKGNNILKNVFNMIPGKKFVWEVEYEGKREREIWDVYSFYGSKYIYCEETKSSAYFKSDDSVLSFDYFKGSNKSLLYYFYLALYKVQTGLYEGLEIRDEFPVDKIFGLRNRFWQDLISPFFIYLKAEYNMKYVKIDEDFTGLHLIIDSAVTASRFNREVFKKLFSISITDKGIESFTVNYKNKKIVAKCIES